MKCIIIGLGTYGRVLVDEMSALGHEVIAADSDAGRVESEGHLRCRVSD